MARTTFDKLDVWNHAVNLTVQIHSAAETCTHDTLSDRVLQAAVSVAALIAAGAERASLKDFLDCVRHARGAAAELRTHLHVMERIGALEQSVADELHREVMALNDKLHHLARSLGHTAPDDYILPPAPYKDTQAAPRRGRPRRGKLAADD